MLVGLLRKDQRGDTIVEVIIAIAVASSALVGAYASTNRNIQSTQLSQERSQGIKLVETQLESLRGASRLGAGNNCFSNGEPVSSVGAQGINPCIVTGDGSQANADDQPAYRLEAVMNPSSGVYEVTAKWLDFRGGENNVSMFYRALDVES